MSLEDREFPSDEDFYSSDYESYVSDSDENNNEPDDRSHEVRPATSRRNELKNGKLSSGDSAKILSSHSSSHDTETIVLTPTNSSETRVHFDGYEPVVVICPRCRMHVTSEVTRRPSKYTWMACIICVCILPCTWEILKDNFHHCPNCKIDLKKHCGDAYGTDEKLEVQRKFSATPTPEKQLKSRSATERNQPKTRPKTRKKRKKKRRVIHRKKSLSLNHAESGSVMASSYFTLPSPRGSHTRARKSSGRRIRVTKISPILKDLEKLNLPRRRELTTTGV